MAAKPKYTEHVRDRLHELINADRQTAARALEILRQETTDELPAEPVARHIAGEERRKRGSVQDMARDEALDALTRRLFGVADRRIRRMERAADVDPNELLTMAKALRELQPLAQAKSNTRNDDQATPLTTVEASPTRRTRQPEAQSSPPGSLDRSALATV